MKKSAKNTKPILTAYSARSFDDFEPVFRREDVKEQYDYMENLIKTKQEEVEEITRSLEECTMEKDSYKEMFYRLSESQEKLREIIKQKNLFHYFWKAGEER